MPPSSFRLQAKNIFLTYPRCDIPLQALLTSITELFSDLSTVTYAVVASELHSDQAPTDQETPICAFHRHVVCCLSTKIHIRDAAKFDVDGFHPNIQACRDLKASIAYCKKDGDFIEFGSAPIARSTWSDCLVACNKEDFLRLVSATSPRDYVLSYDRLLSFAEHHYADPKPAYTPAFTEFNVPDQLAEWEHDSLDSTVGMLFVG